MTFPILKNGRKAENRNMKSTQKTIALSRANARQAAALLRILQVHLESAIESALVPGETEAFAAIDAPHVATNRQVFRQAERIIRAIDIATGGRQSKRLKGSNAAELFARGQQIRQERAA